MATPQSPPMSPMDNPQTDLLNALSALHVGGKYSDLTIVCNYRQWAVHRAIVCSRSQFFDGACSYDFQESANRTIDLSDDDEEAVDMMVQFFYYLDYLMDASTPRASVFRHRATSDARRRLPKKLDLSMCQDPLLAAAGVYTPESPLTPPASGTSDARGVFDFLDKPRSPTTHRASTPPLETDNGSYYDMMEDYESPAVDDAHLVLHTRVYALAEKYDIPSLKHLAKSKFEIAMACYWDSADFAEAIEEVYCSTMDNDRGLRDVVLQTFIHHPELANTQEVYELIQGTPSLATDLFKIECGLPVGLTFG